MQRCGTGEIRDVLRGVDVELAAPPCPVRRAEESGRRPAVNFPCPGEAERDLMRRHEPTLMQMARPETNDAVATGAPRAEAPAPDPASVPVKRHGG